MCVCVCVCVCLGKSWEPVKVLRVTDVDVQGAIGWVMEERGGRYKGKGGIILYGSCGSQWSQISVGNHSALC